MQFWALYCIVLCCIVWYCIVLYCIVLYCIVVCCVVLCCVVLSGCRLCCVTGVSEIVFARFLQVFGVQNKAECWSGPDAVNTYNRHGKAPEDDCVDGKGARWRNDVYRTRRKSFGSMLFIRGLMCFPL